MRGKRASPCTWDYWGSQDIKYCVHVSLDYCNFNFMYYYMHVLTVLHSCIIIQCTDISYDICFMRSLFQNTHLVSIRYFWYFNSSNGSNNNNNKNKNKSNTTKNNICNNNIEYWIPVTSTNNSALNLVALRQLVGVENGELGTYKSKVLIYSDSKVDINENLMISASSFSHPLVAVCSWM